MEDVSDKYGITEHIEFDKKVDELTWNETTNKWDVRLDNGEARLHQFFFFFAFLKLIYTLPQKKHRFLKVAFLFWEECISILGFIYNQPGKCEMSGLGRPPLGDGFPALLPCRVTRQ